MWFFQLIETEPKLQISSFKTKYLALFHFAYTDKQTTDFESFKIYVISYFGRKTLKFPAALIRPI